MAVSIPRDMVEHILLGPVGDRRQVQDSPVLADVWIAFAKDPRRSQDLLITPDNSKSARFVACELDEAIANARNIQTSQDDPDAPFEDANISYLQGIVAAHLRFEELLKFVVPRTAWWQRVRSDPQIDKYVEKGGEQAGQTFATILQIAVEATRSGRREPRSEFIYAIDRYAVLAALIFWAGAQGDDAEPLELDRDILAEQIRHDQTSMIVELAKLLKEADGSLGRRGAKRAQVDECDRRLVYQVSLNRRASLALTRSIPAVKADAARRLFDVDCKRIAWAVVDAGIQGDHRCFQSGKADPSPRIKGAFDFSRYRDIVSLSNRWLLSDNANSERKQKRLAWICHDDLLAFGPSTTAEDRDRAARVLCDLAEDVRDKRPINWETVEPFVRIRPSADPRASDHGTHVAGILGAGVHDEKDRSDYQAGEGMCPNIGLFDFRVIASDVTDTEFSVIAALQFIRHLNARNDHLTIHGVNLSLSIPHDVRNYACGRTPICIECERLVESGVVVVAAAGNLGYRSSSTGDPSLDGYASLTITDPGNADGVITVGSTHRYSPHTYGVSFFSSRGPTGDGRPKPDLVAPGERIRAPIRKGWGDLDGTSMAAPHVSGAAAMLMARYPELIGQPRRIKKILCDSATDLGRERNFQGAGMLDVLRAFQSI